MTGILTARYQQAGLPLEQAKQQAENTTNAVLNDPTVGATMMGLKTQFDQKLNKAIGEYEDVQDMLYFFVARKSEAELCRDFIEEITSH